MYDMALILVYVYDTVLVIAIIDYILHQLLESHVSKDQNEPVKYGQIMKIKSKYLSTPNQVRYNLISMINRL